MTINNELQELMAKWRALANSRDASMLTAHRSTFDRCADELEAALAAMPATGEEMENEYADALDALFSARGFDNNDLIYKRFLNFLPYFGDTP